MGRSTMPKSNIQRTYYDRNTLLEVLPLDTDEELLKWMTGPKSVEFKSDLGVHFFSLGREVEIAQNALTACFTPRYLRNHIWDDFKTK